MGTDSLKDRYFIGLPGSKDMGDKIALYCLIIQMYNFFSSKKPGVTLYQTIKACVGNEAYPNNVYEKLAEICEWLMDGCDKFPDMKLQPKEAAKKIKELIYDLLPF